MSIVDTIRVYKALFFPKIPSPYLGSVEYEKAKSLALRKLAEGSVNVYLGRITTQKIRDEKRNRVLMSDF